MNQNSIQSIKEIISLIEKVRTDCPWVRKQTLTKQLDELKKEIKELEHAINGDNLEEELGDVFWDLLLLIKISEQERGLKLEDILENTRQKIIRRKPYVFGNEKADTPEEAVAIWKRIKEEEKGIEVRE